MTYRLFCRIVGVFLAAVAQQVYAQPADDLLARAAEAIEAERYADSIGWLEQLTTHDTGDAEAFYLLARAHLAVDDLSASKRALRHALTLRPDDPRYMGLQLAQRRASPATFLPPLRRQRRLDLARRILALDSTHALAHQEIGLHEAAIFRQYHQALTFKGRAGNCRDRFDIPCQLGGAAPLDQSETAEAAYPLARRHLEQALASDPTLYSAYAPLLRLHVLRSDTAAARVLLHTMRDQFPDDPAAWLYTGWLRYHRHQLAAAEDAFARAFRTLPSTDRIAFEDLSVILHEDTLAAYQADPGAYAERFWMRNDPRLLTDVNERRLEHYARLALADLLYGVADLRGWDTDRGRIFLRYGPPEQRFVIRGNRFYRSDFSEAGRTGTFIIWEYDDFRFVFEDPESLETNRYRLYSPSAAEFGRTSYPVRDNDYVIRAREIARDRPNSSQYAPPGGRAALPFLASVFKGPGEEADVYVPYGLPEAAASQTPETGLFVLDDAYAVIAETHGTPVLSSTLAMTQDDEIFRIGVEHLRVPAGAYELAVEFKTPDDSLAGYERRALPVPDFKADDLMLSDVLLALSIEETEIAGPGRIVRNGFSIAPAPSGVYAAGHPLYLYFEVYNLTRQAGTSAYEIEAVLLPGEAEAQGMQRLLRRAFGREEPGEGVAARFTDGGPSPDAAHYLILDTQNQPPGHYVLGLRVHDHVSGTVVEASRVVVLETDH